MNISKNQKLELKTPQDFLADVVANELSLAALYLAAADSAEKQQDEDGKQASLKKAFVTYCQVRLQMAKLPDSQRAIFAEEVQDVHNRLSAAYFEDE